MIGKEPINSSGNMLQSCGDYSVKQVAVLQGFEQPEAYWALKNRQRGDA